MTHRARPARTALIGASAISTAISTVRSLHTHRQMARVPALAPPPAGETGDRSSDQRVMIIVPARNEQDTVDECLSRLREQDHPHVRVCLVNDGSTDATDEITRRHSASDSRVRTIDIDGPPDGWTGKVHAMHRGVQAADREYGPCPWLLFLDADMIAEPGLVSHLVSTATALDAELVSTPGGPPARNSSTWSLLMPPGLQMIGENAAPDGRGRRAFAIGQCILVRRDSFDKMGGWAALAGRRNEDVVLATVIRDQGGRTALVDGVDLLRTRGMDPLALGWTSFRKSIAAGVGNSATTLAALGLTQLLLGLTPPGTLAAGIRTRRADLTVLGVIGWLAQATAHRRTATFMRAGPASAALAPLASSVFGVMLLDGAQRCARGAMSWKGRSAEHQGLSRLSNRSKQSR